MQSLVLLSALYRTEPLATWLLCIKAKKLLHSISIFTFISNKFLSFYIVLCIFYAMWWNIFAAYVFTMWPFNLALSWDKGYIAFTSTYFFYVTHMRNNVVYAFPMWYLNIAFKILGMLRVQVKLRLQKAYFQSKKQFFKLKNLKIVYYNFFVLADSFVSSIGRTGYASFLGRNKLTPMTS